MSQKKIIVSMGAEFNGDCFVRIDVQSPILSENCWFYFPAIKSEELNPLYNMEILHANRFANSLNRIKEAIENDKIQDNT